MALVVLGFMLLSKPNSNQQSTSSDNEEQAAEQPQINAVAVDAAQLATLPDLIKEAGVKNADGTYIYNTPTDATTNSSASLILNDSVVSGTVIANGITFSYEDVAAARIPDSIGSTRVTYANKAAAYEALRSAILDAQAYGSFSANRTAIDGETEPIVLANDVISIEISPKGGMISKATLTKKYKTYFPSKADPEVVDTADVVVFNGADWNYGFTLTNAALRKINTADLYFEPVVGDTPNSVTMALNTGDNQYWGIRYTLPEGDSYVVDMEIVSRNMSGQLSNSSTIPFTWYQKMPRQERGRTFEERNSSIYYKRTAHNPNDLGPTDKSKNVTEPISWISFKNQFFSTIVIPQHSFAGADMKQKALKDDPDFVKTMEATTTVDINPDNEVQTSFKMFIGPNLYPLLRKIDKEICGDDGDLKLTRIIPLGWSWVRWINTLIVIPVFTYLNGFITNYGIIILLLTIFIKIILFPFTYKSYMSQAKMRVLAPEIKEINDKYPGQENAMTRQQKTMALYSKAGASPLSGCLPLLLQFPILIAMFSFFPSCIELRGQSFLWAKDLAAPDSILTLPFTIPFYGNHVSLFCLLMTVTNIIYTRINMQNQPTSSSMPGMKWMMYLMPVMFLFFFNDYAAALSYYYFLSLLITIVQTYIFRRCVNEDKLRKKMAENAAKPRKKSGFMARLEEAQRKQQEILRQQQQQQNRRKR